MPASSIRRTDRPSSSWLDLLFAAAFLAHVPLGIEYVRSTLRVGHYQFFPLLVAIALWLIHTRVAGLKQRERRPLASYGLLAINGLLLIAAIITYSPFVWSVSFFSLLGVYLFDRWGWKGFLTAAPAWLLLLLAMPLPANLDTRMIHRLQFLASQLASGMLDAFGVIHFREGVVLITEKKQFFTEEACSGIRSLFSSLAAISVFGVANFYPLWRHAFNWCQTVLWVIVGNAIRIAAVVYLADNVNESFASGTPHELVGLGSFFLIFACAVSTDRAISSWQKTQQPLPDEDELLEESQELVLEGKVKRRREASVADARSVLKWSTVIVFVALAIFSVRMGYALKHEDDIGDYLGDEILLSAEDDLPPMMAGWQRENFELISRDDTRLLASQSYVWTYAKQGHRATLSLDSPYDDFHPLKICYEGLGWDVEQKHVYPEGENQLKTLVNFTELELVKPGEQGRVMFTAFDRVGDLVRPGSGANYRQFRWMMVRKNVMLALGLLDRENDPRLAKQPLPISQLQLIHTGGSELTPGIEQELERLFLEARQQIRRSERFQAGASQKAHRSRQ